MKKVRSTTGTVHGVKPRKPRTQWVTTCGQTLKRPRMVEDYKRVDCTKCRQIDPNLDTPSERKES